MCSSSNWAGHKKWSAKLMGWALKRYHEDNMIFLMILTEKGGNSNSGKIEGHKEREREKKRDEGPWSFLASDQLMGQKDYMQYTSWRSNVSICNRRVAGPGSRAEGAWNLSFTELNFWPKKNHNIRFHPCKLRDILKYRPGSHPGEFMIFRSKKLLKISIMNCGKEKPPPFWSGSSWKCIKYNINTFGQEESRCDPGKKLNFC